MAFEGKISKTIMANKTNELEVHLDTVVQNNRNLKINSMD